MIQNTKNTESTREDIREIEERLLRENVEFSGALLHVKNLDFLIKKCPECISETSITPLVFILNKETFGNQRQAYFLYRETSKVLIRMSVLSKDSAIARKVIEILRDMLIKSHGNKHRAIAETLGSFPLKFKGPNIKNPYTKQRVSISWKNLLEKNNLSINTEGKWMGRTLIFGTTDGRLLALKTVKRDDNLKSMEGESAWMKHLNHIKLETRDKFTIPVPICVRKRYLFRVKALPVKIPKKISLHQDRLFICYMTDHDYFAYPNSIAKHERLDQTRFQEIISRSARLLGLLASLGIVHTAPIPLFHNRVQMNRRSDGGLYEWPRGGRLDKWLSSCMYPNFGESGIRDFEHFESITKNSKKVYEHMGSHIMSLILVSGSYFRNGQPDQLGYDNNGRPMDLRENFDKEFLKILIHTIFNSYYKGFTGNQYSEEFPVNIDQFTNRLIDEMGVDNHMEEILRARDQENMSRDEFTGFLIDRGLTEKTVACLKKGEQDITTLTGPHLGGFNRKISLPELICFLATSASFCISGRYCSEM